MPTGYEPAAGGHPLVDAFVRTVAALSGICGALAAACLASSCVVVCHMVLVRYVLERPTIWQTEFVTFAVVAATLIGSPYVLMTRGHVTVDLLLPYLPARPRRRLALAASICAWAACAVLAWTGWRYFHEAWTFGWTTESVWGPPLWIPLLTLPVGLGMLTLQYTADVLCLLTGRDRRPEGDDPHDAHERDHPYDTLEGDHPRKRANERGRSHEFGRPHERDRPRDRHRAAGPDA